MNFANFFQIARGDHQPPYAYQCRLAGGDSADPQGGFSHGTECRSQLIDIPTGLGKTAAVVLAWLWNRVVQPDESARARWPRRLVYCLPMRTLVEQTEKEVRRWLGDSLWDGNPEKRRGQVGVHVLMGGEDAGEWEIYPEEVAILIGTQDMLLSRALNRGYGMSRYRWPMHFGLLNNDCLWVMDETQLMGVGVETSAQLDGFRSEWPIFGLSPTWWMSATLEGSRLATVNHPPPPEGWPYLELGIEELEASGSRPKALFTAPKAVSRCELKLSPTTKHDYARSLAAFIVAKHQTGTLTLVVINRVGRAQEVYDALTRSEKKSKQPLCAPARVALIHSRFRPEDRRRHESLLFADGDRIVIATQAVEAGVDVSARLLITELGPWASLVQRFGRCNRRAEFSDAQVVWVDIEPDTKGDLLLPYAPPEIEHARAALTPLSDASPCSLRRVKVAEAPVVRPVIRRRDVLDLFDTTPDICGQDLDISRYIRDGEDSDVQFFWRPVSEDGPSPDEKPPGRDEICRVSIGDAAKFLGKKTKAWCWNPLDEQWEPASHARPGNIFLTAVDAGGYDNSFGWTGDPKDQPTPYPPNTGELDRYSADRMSLTREWQTLAAHTGQVVLKTATIALDLGLPFAEADALKTAALWHDIGKAHPDFQKMLRDGPNDPDDVSALYAKSKNRPSPTVATNPRGYRTIRHELASALAWLLQSPADAPNRDLVAYLIASHHGKVRLSIRSLPEEKGDPQDSERLFARGIWHGDKLPAVRFGGLAVPETTLDLSFMKMGEGPRGPSWLARTIALRDRLGPFRLAWLETLLRAADARASRETDH